MIMKRLIESRKLCKLSQEVLSGLIGVARNTYASWESGEREIKAVDLKKIADILGVSMEYLMGDGDENIGEKTSPKLDNICVEMEMKTDGTTIKITIPPNFAESDMNKIFNQIATFQKNTTSPN